MLEWRNETGDDSSSDSGISEGSKELSENSKETIEDSKESYENLNESSENLNKSYESLNESPESSTKSIDNASSTSKSEIRDSESLNESENEEDNVFVDLDKITIPGGLKDIPGYYGFYTEHQPSNSAELTNSKSKFTRETLEIEPLCSIEDDEAKSIESYYPKLIEYEESKIEA